MDVFIGYHADTCASIILHICHELCEENYNDSDSNINTSDDCEEEDEETDNINMWVNDNKDKVCNVIRKTNFPGYVNLENKIFFFTKDFKQNRIQLFNLCKLLFIKRRPGQ